MQRKLTLENEAKPLNLIASDVFQQVKNEEETSVLLTEVKLSDNNEDEIYIDANHIEVSECKRKYVLTEAPWASRASTSWDKFWFMIEQLETTTIVMLCQSFKQIQYWPENPGETLKLGFDLEVALQEETKRNEADFIIRTFILTNTRTNLTRKVQHLHYIAWPDFGAPSNPHSFLNFLKIVRNSGCFEDNVGPPVVHCMTGRGRSGTFALVDSAIAISKEKDISIQDIKSLLLNMRSQRMGLVESSKQFQFVISTILLAHSQLDTNTDEQNKDHED